ncbi:GH25 family lysozyme [Eubacteriaceae bacterium ES2]|nr:GH25 family lysozyme [Eubacteriaceae bacterium ES2]
MDRKKLITLIGGFIFLMLLLLMIILVNIFGASNKNDDSQVLGIDLSAYQGDVDWQLLASQNIDFAFIKATEGADYTDSKFEKNWTESQKTNLKVGAYLFLNFDVTGEDQAQHFIDTVELGDNTLPPVIDLELYGNYNDTPLSKDDVQVILNGALNALEDHYGVKPIIYTTQRIFNMYIGQEYTDYKFWIVDLDSSWPDTLGNGQEFTFWQFSHRGMMDGYEGDEIFIDMNLYSGTYKEFLDEFF